MTRFVDETFQTSFLPTIGVDFKVRTLVIDGYQCKVQIWLVNYEYLHRMRISNIFLLVFLSESTCENLNLSIFLQ
jgi:hypothetical protein